MLFDRKRMIGRLLMTKAHHGPRLSCGPLMSRNRLRGVRCRERVYNKKADATGTEICEHCLRRAGTTCRKCTRPRVWPQQCERARHDGNRSTLGIGKGHMRRRPRRRGVVEMSATTLQDNGAQWLRACSLVERNSQLGTAELANKDHVVIFSDHHGNTRCNEWSITYARRHSFWSLWPYSLIHAVTVAVRLRSWQQSLTDYV
jgi:hypothetical protein